VPSVRLYVELVTEQVEVLREMRIAAGLDGRMTGYFDVVHCLHFGGAAGQDDDTLR